MLKSKTMRRERAALFCFLTQRQFVAPATASPIEPGFSETLFLLIQLSR